MSEKSDEDEEKNSVWFNSLERSYVRVKLNRRPLKFQ